MSEEDWPLVWVPVKAEPVRHFFQVTFQSPKPLPNGSIGWPLELTTRTMSPSTRRLVLSVFAVRSLPATSILPEKAKSPFWKAQSS